MFQVQGAMLNMGETRVKEEEEEEEEVDSDE